MFNEETLIGETLERLLKLRRNLNLEIIVVNDGSTDQSREIVENFKNVHLVNHEKNLGKGKAIVTGIHHSQGGIIVIQDSDLEYSPEDIPRLIFPLLHGKADFVYGSRFLGSIKGMSQSHRVGNMILSLVTRIFFKAVVTDVMTGHKAFSRKILENLELSEFGFGIEVELTAKLLGQKWKLAEIPITYFYRNNGRSKISYIDGLTSLVKLYQLRFSSVNT